MNENYPSSAVKAAQKIRLVLLDVDGVLTDGRLYYGNSGEELKAFNIQDGLGIKLLQRGDIKVGIITGRCSDLVKRRAQELGIDPLVQGREDKLTALKEILKNIDIKLDEIAFVGDDLPDLAVIRQVGLGITPANFGGGFRWQPRRHLLGSVCIPHDHDSGIVGSDQLEHFVD